MFDSVPTARAAGSCDPVKARWARVHARLLHTEGGYNEVKGDRGGATNFGLSLRFLAAECALDPKLLERLDKDNNGRIDKIDVRGLTGPDAEFVYQDYFWLRPGFDTLPQPFDAAMFDQGVNAGCRSAVKLLQRTCNALTPGGYQLDEDGRLGPATRNRLARVMVEKSARTVLAKLRKLTAERYVELVALDPSQRKFLAGWLTRAEALGDV